MNLYVKVVDRLDAFWEPRTANWRKQSRSQTTPSLRMLALHVVGLFVAGFGVGAASVNALLAYLRHNEISLAACVVGVVFSTIYALLSACHILRSFSDIRKARSV